MLASRMSGVQVSRLAVLSAGMLLVSLDQYIVVVALPEIRRDLGFTPQTLQTVVTAYAVVSSGFLLLAGRAADLVGARRVLLAGLSLYGVASLLGGLAWEPEMLLVARAMQGLGGAMVFPTTLTLVSATFAAGPLRNRAVALWGASGAAGLMIGVVLGGVLTEFLGWEAVFLINVGVVVPLFGAVLRLFPRDQAALTRRRFDLLGSLLGTSGISLLAYVLVDAPRVGWAAPLTICAAGSAALLIALFIVVEARTSDALIPNGLFHNRPLGWAVAIAFMFMATFGSVLYFLSILLQDGLRLSPVAAGAAFVPATVAVVAGSALGGRLIGTFGLRRTVSGALASGAVGAVALGLAIRPEFAYTELLPGLLLLSVADGIVFTAMFLCATIDIPPDQQGVASGVASVGSGVGAIVGLAFLVMIDNKVRAAEQLVEYGVRGVLMAVAVGIVLMVPLALGFPSANARSTTPSVSAACR